MSALTFLTPPGLPGSRVDIGAIDVPYWWSVFGVTIIIIFAESVNVDNNADRLALANSRIVAQLIGIGIAMLATLVIHPNYAFHEARRAVRGALLVLVRATRAVADAGFARREGRGPPPPGADGPALAVSSRFFQMKNTFFVGSDLEPRIVSMPTRRWDGQTMMRTLLYLRTSDEMYNPEAADAPAGETAGDAASILRGAAALLQHALTQVRGHALSDPRARRRPGAHQLPRDAHPLTRFLTRSLARSLTRSLHS